jgi:hypothetical protein
MSDSRGSLNPRAISPQLPGGAAPSPHAPEAVAMPEPDLVGQVLDGRYQVMQRLGDGALTTVYEARHSGSGRHFAIKVLRASLASKPHVLDRFLQQARAAAQIRHDNVVAIEEFGYTPTRSVYAAVELVVADTLQIILDRDGRWTWAQARPVALQIVAALKAAHAAGLVHRALRPANCFVVLDPKGKRDPFVKVADFGLAQVGVEANQASPDATTTSIYGDPEYMAPEQGFGGQSTPLTDVYALGVLLFRMLVGHVPFSSNNPFQTISQHAQKPVPALRDVDPQIPEAVEQLVQRCLAKAPEQRYPSAAHLEQALAAIPAGGPAHAAPPAAAPAGSGPRFARFNAGGAAPAAPGGVPPKQPSVIVAGSLGDGSGGVSGTLRDDSDLPPPLPGSSSATMAPPAFLTPPAGAGGGAPSSFLASRPGLRMGLGAAVPGSDGPAPPPTIAPGMAVASPTMFPGSSPFSFGPEPGLPGEPPSYEPSGPSFVGGHHGPASHGAEPLGAGPGVPPLGMGPGIPPMSAGPGIPPVGGGPGGYVPPSAGPGVPPIGQGPGIPPMGAGPGYPPMSAGPGYPPMSAGPGIPPISAGPGIPPMSAGPGIPPISAGPGIPPISAGPGIPPMSAGPGIPPIGVGAGIPPISAGAGVPPIGMGPGIPRAGVGPGMPMPGMGIPPLDDASTSGPAYGSSVPETAAPGGLGSVEYDEDDQPKRRTWLYVVIGLVVILGGIGLALLIASSLEDPEGDVAKVTRTQKAQDINLDADEPEPEPEPEPVPIIEPEPVKTVKKATPKKGAVTFEQSLTSLKTKIRSECKKVGPGPVDINTFVDKAGGKANTPKVEPKGPVGGCALKIVKRWEFPASDEDHPVEERVTW